MQVLGAVLEEEREEGERERRKRLASNKYRLVSEIGDGTGSSSRVLTISLACAGNDF